MKANPFKNFQEGRQEQREELLADYLAFLEKSRLRCKHVTQLAEMAAQYLTDKQAKACNVSTLLRNPRYKKMLLTYMADNLEGGTKSAKHRKIADPAAKVALLENELTISNLRAEVTRLKGYIAHIDVQPKSKTLALKEERYDTNALPLPAQQVSSEKLDLVALCRAIHLIIERLDGIILVDPERLAILDAATLPPSVIVSGSAVQSYVEWLSKHMALGQSNGR